MPSDFRQSGDNHEQLNIYYTSIIVKTRNKYNKFSKKPIKLPSILLPARIKKTIFLHKKFALSKNIPTFAIPFRESSFKTSGNSSVGRARPCQGRGREFKSRFPLSIRTTIEAVLFRCTPSSPAKSLTYIVKHDVEVSAALLRTVEKYRRPLRPHCCSWFQIP